MGDRSKSIGSYIAAECFKIPYAVELDRRSTYSTFGSEGWKNRPENAPCRSAIMKGC